MSVFGDPAVWEDAFPDEFIPDILDILIEVWRALPKPKPTEEETGINQRYCAALRRSRLRSLPLRLDLEVSLLDGKGDIVGRLDFRFTSVPVSDEAYFAVECKRLYAQSASHARPRCGATDYVRSGVMRYVKKRYAPERQHGGMIGYVLSGTAARAISAVARTMQRHRTKLRLASPEPLPRSSLRPLDAGVRESRHLRENTVFQLHHLFLECGPLMRSA